jgi:hypothetical protein
VSVAMTREPSCGISSKATISVQLLIMISPKFISYVPSPSGRRSILILTSNL